MGYSTATFDPLLRPNIGVSVNVFFNVCKFQDWTVVCTIALKRNSFSRFLRKTAKSPIFSSCGNVFLEVIQFPEGFDVYVIFEILLGLNVFQQTFKKLIFFDLSTISIKFCMEHPKRVGWLWNYSFRTLFIIGCVDCNYNIIIE